MKKFKNLFIYSVILASAALYSCEGPMGPAGAKGADGANGTNGTNGVDANETCKLCHNPTTVDMISVQYDYSKHATGLAGEEEVGNLSCAPCHESEGFKYVCKNNTPVAFTVASGVYSNPYSVPAAYGYGAFSCNTCHSTLHTTYGMADLAFTNSSAVDMTMWSGTQTINITQGNGQANLCIKCHQPRPITKSTSDKNVLDYASLAVAANYTSVFFDIDRTDGVANVVKPSYRTGVHYGTVGAIFAGKGGVEFGTGYGNSSHTTVAVCSDCHMADMYTSTSVGAAGGHTFKAKGNFAGCNVTGCHSASPISATSTKFTTPRSTSKSLLDQIAAKLVIGGVEILNRNPDAESNLWLGLTTNNYDGYFNMYDPSSNPLGETNNVGVFQNPSPSSSWTQAQKDHNLTLPKLTLTNAQMGAVINFQLCLREYSLGIHNTTYSTTLLTNTLAALQ